MTNLIGPLLAPRGIKPTLGDIGRQVVYRAAPDYKAEEGVITFVNAVFVFVQYGIGATSKATSRHDLDWL